MNFFEILLITLIDKLVPMTEFVNNVIKAPATRHVKKRKNIQNRLIKKLKTHPSVELKSRIANFNYKFKFYLYSKKYFICLVSI